MGVSIRPCLGCLGSWSAALGTESCLSADDQVHLDSGEGRQVQGTACVPVWWSIQTECAPRGCTVPQGEERCERLNTGHPLDSGPLGHVGSRVGGHIIHEKPGQGPCPCISSSSPHLPFCLLSTSPSCLSLSLPFLIDLFPLICGMWIFLPFPPTTTTSLLSLPISCHPSLTIYPNNYS